MKRIIFSGLLLIFLINVFSQNLPSKSEITAKMKLVNDYWISQNNSPGNNQWARAVYFAGNIEFYKMYRKDNYLQYSNLWATNNSWTLNGGTSTRNADNQTCGQTYIDMYLLDSVKQENKISDIKTSIDNMVYSTVSNDWTWIDALFMSMPVFARLGALTNDSIYFNRMYDLYAYDKYTLGLYNATEGLWYRDSNYKPPYLTKNGQDCYWARGNGWVIAAHARILELLPKNNSHRKEYIETFQQMAVALKSRQRVDGFWNTSLDDSLQYYGPETSGTAFFTYGIAWGINHQILDSATYFPVVAKAWNGLLATAVQTNGFLGYVQGVGAAPALATAGTTQDFGVGAFLLAGTEVVKLAKGTIPTPINFNLVSATVIDKTHVKIIFNKEVNESSALKADNYSINNNIAITNTTKGEDNKTIILTVSDLAYGSYSVTLNNITSVNGETTETGENMAFSYSGIFAVTASDYEAGTSNTPDKTIDFDFSTRWSSDGKGKWIMYDLGGIKQVNSVDLAFYSGASRKTYFSINVSTDAENFTELFNGSSGGKTLNLENFDFTDQKVRYVKIIGFGNSQSTWNSITETRINWSEIQSGLINNDDNSSFYVYPNPFTGSTLFVKNTNTFKSELNIKDLTGKTLLSTLIEPANSKITLNKKLLKGVYIIELNNIYSVQSKMLIVE